MSTPISMFMIAGNPLSCVGGGSDRKSIREILGPENVDSENRILTQEEFALCV